MIVNTRSVIKMNEMSKPSPFYRGFIMNNITNIPFSASILLFTDILNNQSNSGMNELYIL